MKTTLERATQRFKDVKDGYDVYYSFSFDDYYNPDRMHFGALRVLNDFVIKYGHGFELHQHANMEVVTIPLHGVLHHKDSKGHDEELTWGQLKVLSTGMGIYHSERNDVEDSTLELLQIWISPERFNTVPHYNMYDFGKLLKTNEFTLVVAPNGMAPARVLQQAWFTIGVFEQATTQVYTLEQLGNGVYLYVIEGGVNLRSIKLERRDAVMIEECESFTVDMAPGSKVLLIEVPMITLS